MQPPIYQDLEALRESWELALRADGYAASTQRSYRLALDNLAAYVAEQHPDTGAEDVTREQIRGWVVHARDTTSSSTARTWFAGVRHFFRWMVAEGERDRDPTEGIRTPAPNDHTTDVLRVEDIRAMLATCTGRDLVSRRDTAIIHVFADCGLRLAELTNLTVDDVDLKNQVIIVHGKGTQRSGARIRGVPISTQTARKIDSYMRERRKHPHASSERLWLGGRNRANLTDSGVKRMLQKRAERAGVEGVHPHAFRHTMAHQWLADGGSEGDLMRIAGWRSRQMLDRYGSSVAADRAREAHKKFGLGDRL